MKTPGKSATGKAAAIKKPTAAAKRAKAAGKTIGKAAAKAIGKTLGKTLGTTTGQAAAAPTRPAPTGEAMVLDRLFAVVMDRRTADPAISHSARLLSRGMPKVAQKFGEEAVECLIEAVAGNAEALIGESADVLYHLLVMWVAAGIEPNQVWAELARREGMSGVAEKAARPRDGGTTKIP